MSIREGVFNIIKKWEPDAVSIESLFFTKNIKTAIRVAEARGVILLTVADCKIPVFEYTPTEVKRTLTGDGKADKTQIKKMIRLLFGFDRSCLIDDMTDAIAVAWCHCFRNSKI